MCKHAGTLSTGGGGLRAGAPAGRTVCRGSCLRGRQRRLGPSEAGPLANQSPTMLPGRAPGCWGHVDPRTLRVGWAADQAPAGVPGTCPPPSLNAGPSPPPARGGDGCASPEGRRQVGACCLRPGEGAVSRGPGASSRRGGRGLGSRCPRGRVLGAVSQQEGGCVAQRVLLLGAFLSPGSGSGATGRAGGGAGVSPGHRRPPHIHPPGAGPGRQPGPSSPGGAHVEGRARPW